MANRYNAILRQCGILKSPAKIYLSLALTDANLGCFFRAVTFAILFQKAHNLCIKAPS
jgi:hypothetical protein